MDCVLTLDVGSSSARTVLFTFDGKIVDGFGSHITYHGRTTPDGGWEIDAEELARVCEKTLSDACAQLREKNIRPAAVGFDTFWQHILGVGEDNKPVTALLHVFDTRSAEQAKRLGHRIDNRAQHQRTGAVLHPSYVPAKLLWLSETQPNAFRRARQWMTFGEFFFLRIFGEAVASTSMVSGSGLWDQKQNTYDEELMSVLPTEREQFANPDEMDEPQKKLTSGYAAQWPELDGIPWFPALGDGACDNVGSGCTKPDRFALMVGTSGALRVTLEMQWPELPEGLFCYRIDRKRIVLGGALSNGGEVYAWCKRTLQLPDDKEIEKQIAGMTPGKHGMTVMPLFAGERSTKWRADARGAIAGMEFSTAPLEIVRASLEAVALRFRNVYEQMADCAGKPREVIGSGGALLHSPAWVQIMADALFHTVIACTEPEATARGAALVALERIGAIRSIHDPAPLLGNTVDPIQANHDIYLKMLSGQRALYSRLFEDRAF